MACFRERLEVKASAEQFSLSQFLSVCACNQLVQTQLGIRCNTSWSSYDLRKFRWSWDQG